MAENHVYSSQVEFAVDQPEEDNPETLFRQPPTRTFLMEFFKDRVEFPDGAEFDIWGFESDTSGRRIPSPLVRVTEGDIVHATIEPAKGDHTLHWHGIEPDPRNDGVGHTSFEVGESYTYQWTPQRGRIGDPNVGSAGTYFYHCHVNTPLHVQMGMFGPLVVDPEPDVTMPTRPGARRVFVDGPEYDIATEAIVVPYALDPRWHELNQAAGLSGEDVGLNRFDPEHFYLLGGQLDSVPRRDGVSVLTGLKARVTSGAPGAPLPTLLRVLNGGYHPTKLSFTDADGKKAAIAEVIAHDGRQYRDTSVPGGPSRPLRDLGRPIIISSLAFGAAERYELLLVPTRPGTYTMRVVWLHWVTGAVLGSQDVPISVDS